MDGFDFIIDKILANIDSIANVIVDHIIEHFTDVISSAGADTQTEDPAHPFHYLEEFKYFLLNEILNVDKHVLRGKCLSLYTGDGPRLGFDEALAADETDAIKIIGTVIQGISGNYVLILPGKAKEMFDEDYSEDEMGRYGGAFIMNATEYEEGRNEYGWPKAPIWEFSNFPGIPDLFENKELDRVVENKLIEVFKS